MCGSTTRSIGTAKTTILSSKNCCLFRRNTVVINAFLEPYVLERSQFDMVKKMMSLIEEKSEKSEKFIPQVSLQKRIAVLY